MAIGLSAPAERFRALRSELIAAVLDVASTIVVPRLRSASA
jgi:hypothetical protein